MHIPDGYLDAPTSIAVGVVAAAGVAACVRRAGAMLDDRVVPLAGVVSAFVFAGQMLNFPVASGTSGHLLGATLAAVLVGPSIAALCVTVVVVVQALLFADGGLSALGCNVANMALVGVFGGYGAFALMRTVLPRRDGSVVLAAGLAAGVSVVLASLAFTVEYAVGGTADVSLTTVAGAMVGVHTLIGIGEGVLTAMTVGAVLATRPDLVFGARRVQARRRPRLASSAS
jgi:cobalt/nickel transport system permease protein